MDRPLTHSLLTPVLALVVWSLFVMLWMFATRIPAIRRSGVDPAQAKEPSALNLLPLEVRQVGYNYNHLMEQPTLFYALTLYTYLAGHQDGPNIVLAWSYVGLRMVHSLIQGTVNIVLLRFAVFALGSAMLIVMAARDVAALFD